MLKLVLETIDRQFKSTRSRVIGWTLIVTIPSLLAGWAFDRTFAPDRVLISFEIGLIVAGLFVGFGVLTKFRDRLVGEGTSQHLLAAPILFVCYASLMLGVFGSIMLIAMQMGIKLDFR